MKETSVFQLCAGAEREQKVKQTPAGFPDQQKHLSHASRE